MDPTHATRLVPLAALVLASALPARAAAAECVAPRPAAADMLSPGERLDYDVDSLGARVGRFSLHVRPGRGDDAWVLEAKAKTGSFASTFFEVETFAEARLSRELQPRRYQEDSTEDGIRRTTDLGYPVPAHGPWQVSATRQGQRSDVRVEVPADTRDMLSALALVRSLPLELGSEVCVPVLASRRLWHLKLRVAGKERVKTPSGEWDTLHLEAQASRPGTQTSLRDLHFWVSDDPSRTPVAALAIIQNKPVRLQLVEHEPGQKKLARAPRR